MNQNDVMKYETVLPENFDGTFRFTNWTDEDFVGVWGGKEYRFPAQSTSPILMPSQTPLEIQNIRKKFAKNLAEREFFKSEQYSVLMKQERNPDGSPRLNSLHQGGTYSMDSLTPFIQKCLEPLAIAKATVTESVKEPLESKLSRNESGELNTEAVDRKMSLKKKALDS